MNEDEPKYRPIWKEPDLWASIGIALTCAVILACMFWT